MARRSAAESAGRDRGKNRRTASYAVRAFCRLRRLVSVTPEVRPISRNVKANSRSVIMNSAQARLQPPACGVSPILPAIAFGASSWHKMRWAISSSVSTESSGRTAQLRNWRASCVDTESPCARFSKTRRANSALEDIEAQPKLLGAIIISCLFVQARITTLTGLLGGWSNRPTVKPPLYPPTLRWRDRGATNPVPQPQHRPHTAVTQIRPRQFLASGRSARTAEGPPPPGHRVRAVRDSRCQCRSNKPRALTGCAPVSEVTNVSCRCPRSPQRCIVSPQ